MEITTTRPASGGATLASAVPDAARPVDVVAARDSWRPHLGSLGAEDARRARELVTRAMEGLDGPHVIVNRHPAEAMELLDGRVERLTTSHDLRSTSYRPHVEELARAARDRRIDIETRLGTIGVGADRGATTYGSVVFDLQAPDRNGRLSPHHGVPRYGQAALVLDQAVLDRATFLPHDSVGVAQATKPAAHEQLVDVAVERIARDHLFVDDLPHPGRRTRAVSDAARELRKQQLLDVLRDPDERSAIDAVRTKLRGMTNRATYVEAQVRGGVRADDVRELRLLLDEQFAPRWTRTPDQRRIAASAFDALEGAALLRRLPLLRLR
jgi:hypothetical protein